MKRLKQPFTDSNTNSAKVTSMPLSKKKGTLNFTYRMQTGKHELLELVHRAIPGTF